MNRENQLKEDVKVRFLLQVSKRGQLSIFMIIAAAILLAGAIYLAIINSTPSDELLANANQNMGAGPTEFMPLKTYIEECVTQLSQEGIIRIGEQGGYLSVVDNDFRTESFSFIADPTESDAITLGMGDSPDSAIPYWWYLKSRNDCEGLCELSSKRPPLIGPQNSVEAQIGAYVTSGMDLCLDDFSPLKEQGFSITALKPPKATAKIGEEDVSVLLLYPLTARIGDASLDIELFTSRLPVRLKHLYDLGSQITNLEMEFRFLEKHALNLIVAYSGLAKEKLPPMSEVGFKFSETMSWSKSDIKDRITSFLGGQTQLFQVEGTSNFDRNLFDDPLTQRLYDSTLIPNPSGTPTGIDAEFTYLDLWPIYFDLNCDGDSCKPSSANSIAPLVGLQTYRFAYDLSFPVMVELTDREAFNGRGYTMRFALEGNIRNNEVLKSEFRPLETADISQPTLLCDEDSRNSGNITVDVRDSAGLPIPDAQILYTILDTNCFMGTTDEKGRLMSKFPDGVVGGAVSAISPDHIGRSIDFTPTDINEQVTISLSPTLTKKVLVMKKQLKKTSNGWEFADAALPLSEKEQAVVNFRRIPSDIGEQAFVGIAQVDGKFGASEIQIAPGSYEADVTVLLKESVIIPEKEKCFRGGFGSKKTCVKIPEINFGKESSDPTYQEGGFKGNITIPWQKLRDSDTIVLYAVTADLPTQIEDLPATQNVEGNSQTYLVALLPTYEKTTFASSTLP